MFTHIFNYLFKIILALGIHELNFKRYKTFDLSKTITLSSSSLSILIVEFHYFSEWGTRIMDMMCDGHLDCADMLSSVTGLRFLQILLHLCFFPLDHRCLMGIMVFSLMIHLILLVMSIQSLAPRQLVSSEKVGRVEVISQVIWTS